MVKKHEGNFGTTRPPYSIWWDWEKVRNNDHCGLTRDSLLNHLNVFNHLVAQLLNVYACESWREVGAIL